MVTSGERDAVMMERKMSKEKKEVGEQSKTKVKIKNTPKSAWAVYVCVW